MAVGARGKPSAVFQGPVGAFCASTGPAASTASWSVHGSGRSTRHAVSIRDQARALDLATCKKQVGLQVGPGRDRHS